MAEIDPRQGDLFLTLLQGGKQDEGCVNYRKKFDEESTKGIEPTITEDVKQDSS